MLRGWGHQRLLVLCDVKAPYFPGDEGHHVVIFRPHPTHAIMNSLHTTCLAILRLHFWCTLIRNHIESANSVIWTFTSPDSGVGAGVRINRGSTVMIYMCKILMLGCMVHFHFTLNVLSPDLPFWIDTNFPE